MSAHVTGLERAELEGRAALQQEARAAASVTAVTLRQRLDEARVDLLAHIENGLPEREWVPASRGMLARGKRHHIPAPLKSGKSLGMLVHAVNVVDNGGYVVIVDRENGADEYARRLRDVLRDRPESTREAVRQRLVYYAWPAITLDDGPALAAALAQADLVIIDSTRAILSSLSLAEDSSDDFAKFSVRVIEPLFRAGIATVLLDNTGHSDSTRARGSASKGDLADVVFTLKAVEPFDARQRGRLRLVRAHSRFGDVAASFDLELGGGHFGRFAASENESVDGGAPADVMRRVLDAIKADPGLSKRAVRQAVQGSNDHKDDALDELTRAGDIRVEQDGRAKRYYPHIRPCRTVPEACRGTGEADRADVPRALEGTGTRHVSTGNGNGDRAGARSATESEHVLVDAIAAAFDATEIHEDLPADAVVIDLRSAAA